MSCNLYGMREKAAKTNENLIPCFPTPCLEYLSESVFCRPRSPRGPLTSTGVAISTPAKYSYFGPNFNHVVILSGARRLDSHYRLTK